MKNNTFYPGARPVCLVFLLSALVYGLVLPFCWHNDPSDTYGTLSLLCENHIPFFWVWAVLTGLGITLNLEFAYQKYGYTGKSLRIAAVFGLFGMILTAATLNHSIQDWNPKRVAHWTGAICFAAGFAVAFIFFFIGKVREFSRFRFFIVLLGSAAAGVLVQLLTVGRNGYMEIVPLALEELTLLVINTVPASKLKISKNEN
ncbi:MAG: hypothetical protein K6G90_06960 [Clostridia bacterium]|nr:hypothetical protein [Clostridia bacterium]